MIEKEITLYPKQYHAVKLRVQAETFQDANKQLMKEFNRIKKTLPVDEITLALELLE